MTMMSFFIMISYDDDMISYGDEFHMMMISYEYFLWVYIMICYDDFLWWDDLLWWSAYEDEFIWGCWFSSADHDDFLWRWFPMMIMIPITIVLCWLWAWFLICWCLCFTKKMMISCDDNDVSLLWCFIWWWFRGRCPNMLVIISYDKDDDCLLCQWWYPSLIISWDNDSYNDFVIWKSWFPMALSYEFLCLCRFSITISYVDVS